MFTQHLKRYRNRRCLGRLNVSKNAYVWLSYAEVEQSARHIGSALINDCGALPQSLDDLEVSSKNCVGIFSRNCPEWVVVELACHTYNLVSVGLYDVSPRNTLADIINQLKMSIIVCGERVEALADALKDCPTIETVILLPLAMGSEVEWPERVRVVTFDDLEVAGVANPLEPIEPSPSSLATICFTSGTTGRSKGVELTHDNFVASIESLVANSNTVHSDAVYFSYLPLVHMFERSLLHLCLFKGASIGFYRGDILRLFEDAEILKPTVFVSVPRIYNRLYTKIEAGISQRGGVTEFLYSVACGSIGRKLRRDEKLRGEMAKEENRTFRRLALFSLHRIYLAFTYFLYDFLLFKEMRKKLGGKIEIFITGAAPISPHVMETLSIVFGARFCVGYGCTETTIAGSASYPQFVPKGNCGTLSSTVEVKITPAPEYTHSKNDGEICIRGRPIFRRYYQNPEETERVIDSEGWYHTGDIGCFDQSGALKITGRMKEIFKLSQGEYISPEAIELVYLNSDYVDQIFVYGDSLQSQLVALMVPNHEHLKRLALKLRVEGQKIEDLCGNPHIIKAVLSDLTATAVTEKLRGFEQVKAVYLMSVPFDEKDFTPTRKMKRHVIAKDYRSTLDALYKQIGAS
mmetsp:Transcript_12749/g.17195  ORF Transcript_12749/g.17195 Transcript_12749/m.17195 type:complete len:633 (-) Transcript_12749:185-2083(-)